MITINIHTRYRTDDAETKHDPKNGQFTSGGGGAANKEAPSTMSGGTTKISKRELKKKLSNMPYDKLNAAYANKHIDPEVRELIGKELDERASRGNSKGLGELGY